MEGALSRASHPARGCLGERRKGQPNSHTCARSRGARVLKRGKRTRGAAKGGARVQGVTTEARCLPRPPQRRGQPNRGRAGKGECQYTTAGKGRGQKATRKGPPAKRTRKAPYHNRNGGSPEPSQPPSQGVLGGAEEGAAKQPHLCTQQRGAGSKKGVKEREAPPK